MNQVSVSVFARTDIGMQRAGNEDAFLVADLSTGNIGLGPEVSMHQVGDRGSLMVVSDGMGGAAAGEIASEMAVTAIKETLMTLPLDMEISERLVKAATTANERVWNHAQENPEMSGMGATLTAVLVQSTIAYIAQVGDSRAYLIRGEQIKQITKDQSLAQMLVDSGIIEASQMETVPQNVIMQALGTQPNVTVVMTSVELFRNDCLVLCSDGLSNKVKPEEIRDIIGRAEDITAACRMLIEIANERGGEDNITVIVARFDGESLHTTSDSTTITASLKALSQDYIHERAPGFANSQATASPAAPADQNVEATTQVMQAVAPAEATAGQEEAHTNQREPVTTLLTSPAPAPDPLPEPEADARPTAPGLQTTPLATTPLATDQIETNQVETNQAETNQVETKQVETDQIQTTPLATSPLPKKRKSYATILIIALVSLLLLAAASYFAYIYYLKPRLEAPPADELSLLIVERPDPRFL